ncbi:hypothetical protein PQR02_33870 [Paraburkholderia sediminicola]|uniref:Uncharacterized protein n=1 Tax=Paraburkholderia rhynchosiae TaxID=487049 RepID=A0ACC7NL98_9BURK
MQYENYGLNLAAAYYNEHGTKPSPISVATVLNNNRFYYTGALYSINGFTVSTSFSSGRNPAHASTTNFDMISGGFGYRFTPAFEVTSDVYYIKGENKSATNRSNMWSGRTIVYPGLCRCMRKWGYVDNRAR